MCFETAVT